MSASPDITRLLDAARDGDGDAVEAVFARVYDELRRLARTVRAGRAGETLATTVLVHEAYLKMVPAEGVAWESRSHFFGVAARAMRQILVDAARRRTAAKRGGEARDLTLDERLAAGAGSPEATAPEDLIALDAALRELADVDPRKAEVVERRFFAGLSMVEVAEHLGISVATAERDWRAARAWLAHRMRAPGGADG